MAKENQLTVELSSEKKKLADTLKFYLPKKSKASEFFKEPVSMHIKAPIQYGHPPKTNNRAMKVFVGDTPRWQDSQPLMEAFCQIWFHVLQLLDGLSKETVELLYFSGQATDYGLFSLWPYLPFGDRDNGRFFVSEVCKDSRTNNPASIWLCVEYSYDDFKRMIRPDGFEYTYGTTIMGMSVFESKVDSYLRKDLIDKSILEDVLEKKYVRCWWFCDPDFEGITIYHKDYSGNDLLIRLQNNIKEKIEEIGGQILIC